MKKRLPMFDPLVVKMASSSERPTYNIAYFSVEADSRFPIWETELKMQLVGF
jgi:hypothetical protein